MCLKPQPLYGSSIEVPCRACWQCRLSKVNDLVGRSMAEGLVSDRSYFLTLTFGRDEMGEAVHQRAVLLATRDWQHFMKRLRKALPADTTCRYLAMGEYGSLYGRAHWHGILHFRGPNVPEWPLDERFHTEYWAKDGVPIGFVEASAVTYQSTKYVCKYVLKDSIDKQAKPLYSRFPPLGHDYFVSLARQRAAVASPPTDLYYTFPVQRASGRGNQRFRLKGKSADTYMREFVAESERLGHEYRLGQSALLDDFLMYDRVCKHELVREKHSADLGADMRFVAWLAQTEVVSASAMANRYSKPFRGPTNMAAYFLKLGFDNGPQRQGYIEALEQCWEFDPAFDPSAPRWARDFAKAGIRQPTADEVRSFVEREWSE